jgi:hypothetical protein
VYETLNLSGRIDDEVSGFGAVAFFQSGLQNGSPDGLALIDQNGVVVSSGGIIQFLSYEGGFTATAGAAIDIASNEIGVDQDPAPAVGLTLQLTGLGSVYADFAWTGPLAATPDFLNLNQSFPQTETEIISEPGPTTGVPEAGASLVLLALSWAGIRLLAGARLKEVG